MEKLLLAAAVMSFFLQGCARTCTVRVNGFLEAGKAIRDGAAIYVAADANSPNPIFEKEIKGKIEQMLSQRGYSVAAGEELADYRLGFDFGVHRREVWGVQSYYGPDWFGYGGYRGSHYYGWYGAHIPYTEVYHDQWLSIRVSDTGRENAAAKGAVIWVGEAVTTRFSADMRETINYLLAAVFEYFGRDTKKRTRVKIEQSDPRITELTRYGY
ncbi:MAG TPA: DUF4136 domain-containing protein [Sedimentisphaerales bacterium]|nr:DUF4136 domain-containing protein [Sedimentisphaerales bacterium]